MLGLRQFRSIFVAITSLLAACLSLAADAKIRFDVPAQSLAVSLGVVGNVANVNVLFDSKLVDNLQAPALQGELSPDEAILRLLVGTRLRVLRVNEKTLTVVTQEEAERVESERAKSTSSTYIPGPGVHYASADSTSPAIATSDRDTAANGSQAARDQARVSDSGQQHRLDDVAEVLVTAQKRTERLEDVPVPVTAINTQDLAENNQLRLQDYYTSIPGLSVTPDDGGLGAARLTIRGITTGGFSSPTVGVTIDDMPYGSSTDIGYGSQAPDIDPSDLARVEVLRGPQGTLYGASSMGGLVKFITLDPSTEAITGHVQAGANTVHHGSQLGYSFHAAVNLPVSDTLAVRASGFTRQDPGYIDDPGRGIDGVNRAEVYGARVAGLWRPTEETTLKISALLQNTRGDGSPYTYQLPGLGDLQQSALRATGQYTKRIQAYSANLTTKIYGVDLVSVTGYNVSNRSDVFDYTPVFGTSTDPDVAVTGTPLMERLTNKKFSQEIRLSAPIGTRLSWLLGGFYTHESAELPQHLQWEDPVSGALLGTFLDLSSPSTFSEYAGFADITVNLTDRFDVQLGARESQISQTLKETYIGPYVSAFLGAVSPLIYPETHSKANSFTYLVTPRFRFSNSLMLYARLASGYRAGGININASAFQVPAEYKPDTTRNYEIGIKGDALNHALSFDASVYYIDWKDIQLVVENPSDGASYNANGSRAKSQGVEVSLEARPFRGLSVSTWVAWNDAVLTDGFPPNTLVYGGSGDRLPYSSRFSGSISVEEQFPITEHATGYVGGSLSYASDRLGVFASTFGPNERQVFPAYAKTDLRIGVRQDMWNVNLFVNNLADKRGVLSGGVGSTIPFAFDYIQPRTIGASVDVRF